MSRIDRLLIIVATTPVILSVWGLVATLLG